MSKLYSDYTTDPLVIGKDAEVTDQHPLPVRVEWRRDGDVEWQPAGESHGLPVELTGTAKTTTNLSVVSTPVPGIVVASPYAAGDAFGVKFAIQVPVEGTIATVIFRDYDDEGLAKEIVLFSENFTETADNGAFTPSDDDLRSCVGVISIATFYDFGANQIGVVSPALYYVAPRGILYGQMVTRGADNIAAGSIPTFSLVIT